MASSESELEARVAAVLSAPTVPERWVAAEEIARHGRPALRLASRLLNSAPEDEQVLGAQILGRLDPRDTSLCCVAVGELTCALAEGSPVVKAEVALSLARLPGVTLFERLALLRYDTRAGVRLACAMGLALGATDAQRALIELARDVDREVRTWAAFALAGSESDSEPLRATLRDLASDVFSDIRGEALVGLACRADPCFSRLLLAELAEPPSGAWVAEAAALCPSAAFVERLRVWQRTLGEEGRSDWDQAYARAIEACEALPRDPMA